MSQAASNGVTWVEEHPEEVKNAGLVCAAVLVFALTLYALVPAITALLGAIFKLVLGVLKLLYWLVMLPIELVLRSEHRVTRSASTPITEHILGSRHQDHQHDPEVLRLHGLRCQIAYVGSHARFSQTADCDCALPQTLSRHADSLPCMDRTRVVSSRPCNPWAPVVVDMSVLSASISMSELIAPATTPLQHPVHSLKSTPRTLNEFNSGTFDKAERRMKLYVYRA